jgi:hypothetical protein
VKDAWVFLAPILPCIVLWVVLSLARVNAASWVLHYYFMRAEPEGAHHGID